MNKNKKNTFKMIVLGSYGVGKTSIVDRLVHNEFKYNETTIGASFNNINHDNKYNLNIWDTAGQERYRSITQIYYKDVDIALMVYNMNHYDSLSEIDSYWMNQFYNNNYIKENKRCHIYIIGNLADTYYNSRNQPNDLTLHENRYKIINKMSLEFPHIKFFEVSAKSGYGIQRLYDTIFEDLDSINFTPPPPEADEDYFIDGVPQKTGNKCC